MDTVFLALRVAVALGAVFGALLLGHRWITKGRPGARTRDRRIAVVARQGLGAKAGVAVVDAAGRRYVLGVTEHAVTVLDTLGAADEHAGAEPALVEAQPIAVARFEQELRTVTIATANVPVVVHGGAEGGDPSGPITQTLRIAPAGRRIQDLAVAPPLPSRREARLAEQQRGEAPDLRAGGPLAGSVLSPTTWRQTFDALKRLR